LKKYGILLLLLSVFFAAGCSPTHPQVTTQREISRISVYGSLGELAGDSDLVAIGKVSSQKIVTDVDPAIAVLISTVVISSTLKGEGSESVTVRQLLQSGNTEVDGNLQDGKTYLLYLTPSQLKGDLASQYYPVGVTAGIFESSSNTSQFNRLVHNEGDKLPNVVSAESALG
jgi:hypothetical protein